jgi:hypothetical protein
MLARRTTLRMSSLPGAAASSVATLPRSRRNLVSAERVRESHLDAGIAFVDRDQAAQIGVLDGFGIRNPPQRPHL